MTRVIRQKFSGKTFTVIAENEQWLVLRPIPDDHGPDIKLAQSSFPAKWENVKPEGTRVRKRGRPKGSKNKPKD